MSWIFKALFVVTVAMGANWEGSPAATALGEQRPVPAKEFACGGAGNPCPLQGWMRATFASAATKGDADVLAKGFEFLASKPPPGYTEWTRIAKEGAALARKRDIEGAKSTCQTCHTKYKSKYRAELRDRSL